MWLVPRLEFYPHFMDIKNRLFHTIQYSRLDVLKKAKVNQSLRNSLFKHWQPMQHQKVPNILGSLCWNLFHW